MIISHSKKFVFIHVYKTAGTSVTDALQKWNSLTENIFLRGIEKTLNIEIYTKGYMSKLRMINRLKGGCHADVCDLQRNMPEEMFKSYFKFAFVRNPWAWQVSLYEYSKRKKGHHQREMMNKFLDFNEYIHWRVENEVRYQTDVLLNKQGKFGLNYLGRVEDIDKDFEFCCKQLNIQAVLPKHNVSVTKDYRTYYSEKTAQMVAEAFQKDIDNFGYDFDGVSSTAKPKLPVQEIVNN
ncbi:MAG: sulfotransferase family 2 domain-containing protein [Nostoc sp. TH1S01]|nr:sulfotransferase family 2 domain-containing protein [Nostoc sp. TH1S01]